MERLAAHSLTDDELILQLAEGRREALGVLYDRHAACVLRVAHGCLQDRGDAEDLVQEVFLELWRRASTHDPLRGSVRTLLVVLARSRSLDRIRRRRRLPLPIGITPDDDRTSTSDAGLWPSADGTRLRDAVAGLPAILRDAITLIYFDDLTTAEAAERLGVPQGTVKSRIRIARSALRTLLDDPVTFHADETASSPKTTT